jgi:predicted CopG family antitoxin
MTTTIAVKEDTMELLRNLREQSEAETFDETIRQLIASAKKPGRSFFGKFKGLGTFKREEIDRFD